MPDLSKLIKMDNLNLDFSDLMDGDKLIESIPADQVPDLADALKRGEIFFHRESDYRTYAGASC